MSLEAMMQSKATKVEEYLAELPQDRSAAISHLVALVRSSIRPGFDETMRWGMVSFEVPMALSGPTYNNQPLNYIGIASQKNHISIYLMGIYLSPALDSEFRARWARSGKKLDMGKACVRFKSLEQADLPTLAWAAGLHDAKMFANLYQSLQRK